MFQNLPPSSELISKLLSRESEEYQDAFNSEGDIDALVEHARNIIQIHTTTLEGISEGCRLDGILPAILEHAPHPEGRRYVALVLVVAHKHGPGMVVGVARAWMDVLFKIYTIFRDTGPKSSLFDESGGEYTQLEDDPEFRDLREKAGLEHCQVARRQQYCCPISRDVDGNYGQEFLRLNYRFPPGASLAATRLVHIVPPSLVTPQPHQEKGTQFIWAVLKAWACIDIPKDVESKINTPANAICMSNKFWFFYYTFWFYLEAVGRMDNLDEYKAYATMKGLPLFNGDPVDETHVIFNFSNSIDPPDAKFLGLHAALTKVLRDSGLSDFLETSESDLSDLETSGSDSE